MPIEELATALVISDMLSFQLRGPLDGTRVEKVRLLDNKPQADFAYLISIIIVG